MKKIKLLPLIGVNIENIGIIQFGLDIHNIKLKLGEPNLQNDTELYYDEFRIDLNENKEMEFIEFQGPTPKDIDISIYDVNPFTVCANKLLEILAIRNKGTIDDSEAPYCYCFMNISVGLWREFVEKDILDTIENMKNVGDYEKSKEWINLDLEKSKFFWSIGIGRKDYYKLFKSDVQ